MLRAEKCALPFFFQTYPAQTMVRLIHGQQKPSWVPTGHCATRKKVLCERAAATHAAPASIPRPLDAVRVRRKPVGRCDRHGRLRATTRSSLWRAIFFSVTNGPQLCQDDGAWVLWFARPSFAGLAVAEDSSVRPGWQQMAWAGACLQRFIAGSSALARRKQGNVSRDLQS
jgi:hypothetical protein